MSSAVRYYLRRSDVALREVDDEVFLLDSKAGRIHHMNATGAALWRLIAAPTRLSEAVRLFSDAFPEQTRRAHKKRLKSILHELDENDLLQACADLRSDSSGIESPVGLGTNESKQDVSR